MTELSQTILDRYQVRKTKKQKQAFIDLLRQHFPDLQIQEGGFPKSRNLIIGDVKNAKVLLSAHYDTCPRMLLPNMVMPKSPILSFLYGLLITVPILILIFAVNYLISFWETGFWVHYIVSLVLFFILLLLGPANRHTANDNTSGVITLCELLVTLTPEQREKAAFLFFDNEELGLLGSSLFRAKFKKQLKDKLLINFDCVSDGDHILIAAGRSARKSHGALLDNAFRPTEEKTIILSRLERVYYPSDQAHFPKAVAVAAMRHKLFPGYFIPRIHTEKDTVFDRKNIKLLCDGVLRLLKNT